MLSNKYLYLVLDFRVTDYNIVMEFGLTLQNKKSDDDIKRYIGSLTEEYQSRVSSVAEQHAGTNEKIDTLGKEVKAKLDMHTEMIGVIMEDVAVLKEDVAEAIQGKADAMNQSRKAYIEWLCMQDVKPFMALKKPKRARAKSKH